MYKVCEKIMKNSVLKTENLDQLVGRPIAWKVQGYDNQIYSGISVIKYVRLQDKNPITSDTIGGDNLDFAFVENGKIFYSDADRTIEFYHYDVIYKGFVIACNDKGTYNVLHSDIKFQDSISDCKNEIDRNLNLQNKKVAEYRGISIYRKWQNVECITRNGEDVVDNGFYYYKDVFNGTLSLDLNCIKDSIDSIIKDRDSFYKKNYTSDYNKFMSKVQ